MMLDATELLADLSGAVERGEIAAVFQPQVTVGHGDVVAAEALSRWWHPSHGLIPPDEFIPLAEEGGQIHEIGAYMMRAACEFAAAAARSGTPIEVAVNVSAVQLRDHGFAASVVEILNLTGLAPNLLTIEITESTAVLDVSTVAERLDWLRSVGVSISVDDFGTGHSSVDQVFDLRATELKIDQSLIRDESATAATLLQAVVAFAHNRGLRVVAEGVETLHQMERVVALHCDRAQGYLIGRPVAGGEFEFAAWPREGQA